MKKTSDTSHWWRTLLMIPIAIFAIVSILATGHDDDDDPPVDGDIPIGDIPIDDLPATILSQYNFSIGSVPAGPLTVSVGAIGSISVDLGTTLLGAINLDASATGDVTLLSTTTNAGSSFTLTGTSTVPGLEVLNASAAVSVTSAISANVFDDPTSGSFEITTTPPLGAITVDISGTGVDISLDGGTPTSYTWEEFTDLLGSPSAQPHELVAALVGGAYEFIFELALDAADNLDELELVTLSNPTIEQCDMFTGTQPPMVLAQGQTTITWTGSGELLPGQDFTIDFDDCWLDDPTDNTDDLLNGIITLQGYVEDVDASNTLTRVGFDAVLFQDFTEAETEEDTGVFTIDPSGTTTVNGGFSVIFSAP